MSEESKELVVREPEKKINDIRGSTTIVWDRINRMVARMFPGYGQGGRFESVLDFLITEVVDLADDIDDTEERLNYLGTALADIKKFQETDDPKYILGIMDVAYSLAITQHAVQGHDTLEEAYVNAHLEHYGVVPSGLEDQYDF